MPEFMKVAVDGQLATLTFARAQGLNTFSSKVLQELGEAWEQVEKSGARVCILHGEGKVFLAGADIKELHALDARKALDFAALGQGVFRRIELSPVVSIAAMHGAAVGGGCELALACDIRLASDDLKIGQPEVNLGLIPGFGGTQRLPRVVGEGAALRLILSGEAIGAAQAQDLGLVSVVGPAAQLLDEAKKLAATILSRGPLAVKTSKELVRKALSTSIEAGLAHERNAFANTYFTGEAHEGTKAFLEKRAAKFS